MLKLGVGFNGATSLLKHLEEDSLMQESAMHSLDINFDHAESKDEIGNENSGADKASLKKKEEIEVMTASGTLILNKGSVDQ